MHFIYFIFKKIVINATSHHMLENHKIRKNEQKANFKKKMLLLFLFSILIIISAIIFGNFFDSKIHGKIHLDKEIVTNEKADGADINSNIDILEHIKRILSDTQINTWTNNNQQYPSIANLSDGNFIVIWQSYLDYANGSSASWGIYGQIFYSNGAKKRNQFPISNNTAFNQTYPKVKASSSSKFMVIWLQSDGNIFGQIYINDNTKLNNQFQINTITNSNIEFPSITSLKNNNFVIIWDDQSNIYVQIFTDNGTKVGSQLNIASGTLFRYSSITSLANGNFVATYRCYPGICAIIFYSDGTMLKSAFSVNTYNYYVGSTSISSVSNSNFMIAWESRGHDIIGASDWGIYAQSFTSSGTKIGNEFRVNTYIISDQANPSITSLTNDNYIVSWYSSGQDGSGTGIYSQILDGTGNKIGNEFKVNVYTYSDQSDTSVSSLVNNNFVTVWDSYGQDGNKLGIFGNIYQNDGSVVGFNACPFNCQSCINSTNCIACNLNFKLEINGLCACSDGFYLDNISGYVCMSMIIILNLFIKSHSRLS